MLTNSVHGHFITIAMLLVGKGVLSKQDNKILDSFSASCVLSLLIGLILVLSLMIWMCRTCLQTTTLILIIRGNILPCGLPHVLAVVDIDQTVSKTILC